MITLNVLLPVLGLAATGVLVLTKTSRVYALVALIAAGSYRSLWARPSP